MRSIFDLRFLIFNSRASKWVASALIAALIPLCAPSDAAAQGCAMCYTSASAAKKAGMEALQNGVFILFFPPLLIFAAILWHTFHRRGAQEPVEMDSSLAPQPLGLGPLE